MNRVAGRWVLAAAAATILLASLGARVTTAAAATTAKVRNGTLMVTGDSAGDKVALSLQAGPPSMIQIDVGEDGIIDFAFDRSTFSTIDVSAHGGDDELRIDQSGGAITGQPITLDGGAGNDTLIGGNDGEHFIGGSGNDFVDGNIGSDVVELGTGSDTFNWDPGDAGDTIEGGGGLDTLQFNASNIGEKIEFEPNGSRVLMTRDIATVTMDLNGIETTNVNALGGADTVTVGDLAGTGMNSVNVNLAGISGGDGAADTVVVDGTAGPDSVALANAGGGLVVNGLFAQTRVTGDEAGLDVIAVDTLAGNDQLTQPYGVTAAGAVSYDGGDDQDSLAFVGTLGDDTMTETSNGAAAATFSPAGVIVNSQPTVESVAMTGLGGNDQLTAQVIGATTHLTLDGGSGDDTLLGSNGNDLLLGGSGNDFVDGNIGTDTALLGTGNDTFNWDPGDTSDTIEGEGGHDTLQFNASNIGEKIELSANGTRLRLTRDVASITTDAAGIETVNVRLLGGADTLTINDLTGTEVSNVNADLSASGGGGDGAADTVVVNGTAGPDVVHVTPSGSQVVVGGLQPHVQISGSEPANDTLLLQTLDGDDSVTVDPGVSALINPIVDLGPGE